MSSRGAHNNRIFTDMRLIRRTVEALIDQTRFRIQPHARSAHQQFSDSDRVAVVRWGGRDSPDRTRPLSDGVYVCWATHPVHGLCRAAYAVEQTSVGEILVIITVMPEE